MHMFSYCFETCICVYLKLHDNSIILMLQKYNGFVSPSVPSHNSSVGWHENKQIIAEREARQLIVV